MGLLCPRCAVVELQEIELADLVIDRCQRCAGLWFDYSEIAEILGQQNHVGKVESMVPEPAQSQPSLDCPRCSGVTLRRLELEGRGGCQLVLFRCVSCMGSWLDRGELAELEDPHLLERLRGYFSALADDGHEDR